MINLDSKAQGWLCDGAPPPPWVSLQHVGLRPVSVRRVQRLLVSGRLFDLGKPLKYCNIFPSRHARTRDYLTLFIKFLFYNTNSLSLLLRKYHYLLLEVLYSFRVRILKQNDEREIVTGVG